MWFLRAVKQAKAFCCEPDPENLKIGRANAQLNNFKVDKDIFFNQYAAGLRDNKKIKFTTQANGTITVPKRSVDSIIAEEGIDKLDILHLDIQGAELDALKGARQSIQEGKLRFVFVSTHHYSISGDPATQQKCLAFIQKQGGHIVAKHTVLESCSGDGLIVASFDKQDRGFTVAVSLQPADDSLFRASEQDVARLWRSYDKLQRQLIKLDKTNQQLDKLNKRLQGKIAAKQAQLDTLSATLQEITPLKKHIKQKIQQRFGRITSRRPKDNGM